MNQYPWRAVPFAAHETNLRLVPYEMLRPSHFSHISRFARHHLGGMAREHVTDR